MSGSLANRVALVTGASSGIGQAIAIALGSAGAQVIAVARRAERLQNTVATIKAAGGNAIAMAGDLSDDKVATDIVAKAIDHFGRLDILVNAAGVIQSGNVETADLTQWRRLLEVNVLATLYTCHAALATMRAQGSGNIVNIGSLACRTTSPIYNPYTTSKFALNAMTDGLRQEAGAYGVRVCMIAPGPTKTDVAEGISDPVHREAIRAYIHQDGALDAKDIAETVLFVVTRPPHANISEVWIRATTDVAY